MLEPHDKKYAHRIEEIRMQAFNEIAKLVDKFVEDHWGDQPSLVQFALMLEMIEAIATYSVISKIDLSKIHALTAVSYNRYKEEFFKEKREK